MAKNSDFPWMGGPHVVVFTAEPPIRAILAVRDDKEDKLYRGNLQIRKLSKAMCHLFFLKWTYFWSSKWIRLLELSPDFIRVS